MNMLIFQDYKSKFYSRPRREKETFPRVAKKYRRGTLQSNFGKHSFQGLEVSRIGRNFVKPLFATTALDEALVSSDSSNDKKAKVISWAGAGVFFFWQLGAMKYLAGKYDLTTVPMVGASGGALAAVLAACGVPADVALKHAYTISVKNNIWEKPISKLGTWGSLIEQWLNDVLPDDAADRCRNRITVVVTTLPNMAQVGISDFADKADLINCAMASAHIPVCLDFKFARPCRGKLCIDGSLPDFFYNDNCELLKLGGAAVIFDYCMDKCLTRKGRMDMLSIKQYEEILQIMDVGYRYAEGLHLEGHLGLLEVGEVAMEDLDERPLSEQRHFCDDDGGGGMEAAAPPPAWDDEPPRVA